MKHLCFSYKFPVVSTRLLTSKTLVKIDRCKNKEIKKNKVVCGLAYIPILFWLPLVAGTKGSKYCKFHSNNGLLILIIDVVISIVGSLLGLIPIVGLLTSSVLGLIVVAYIVFGMVFTFQGKVKELPFIGGIKIIS